MDDVDTALTSTNTISDGAVWGSSCSCRTGTSRILGPVVPSRPATTDGPVRTRWEHQRVPSSADLSLRWLTSPAEVTPALRADLTTCWRDVVNDGERWASPSSFRSPRTTSHHLGLDSLRLEVRGGAGLEAFYVRFGWTVVGTWPGALQFTRHGRRDEVLMAKDLRSP